MEQNRSRLAKAFRKSTEYRIRSSYTLLAFFTIAWAALCVSVFFKTNALTHTAIGETFALILLSLVLLISLIWVIFNGRTSQPLEEEITNAQQTLEASITRQFRQIEGERLKVRNSINAADKSRHDFLNTMSIELRNPLNSIIGFSTLLYQNIEEKEVQHKRQSYAFDINRSAMHLLNIINQILDVSNLGTGSSDLRIERVSALDLVETCHRLSEIRGTKTGLAFIYDLPGEDFYFNCDQSRMKQIILNLYSNAVKFTDPPGAVYVKLCQTNKGDIQFNVRDEGIGIPVDDLKIVLQRFGKVDSQDYAIRNEDGLGLGLTLVQELTKMHQGEFTLESAEDVGTEVTITIPGNLMINTDGGDVENEAIQLSA